MRNLYLASLFLMPLAAPALAASNGVMRLDLFQGTQEVTVKRGNDILHLKEGNSLQPKDELSTGPKESVRIIFPDGSQIWVGSSTTVQVNSGVAEGGAKIQLVHMKEGTGRILVPKSYGTTKKIKFVVKTPAATMGVRGTDFVVDARASGKDIELHTLEGSVDAAKSVRNLIQKDAVAVETGFTIHALDSKPLPQPKSFDVKEFTTELNRREPAFVTYSMRPPQQTDQGAPSATQQQSPAPGETNAPLSPGLKGKVEGIMQQHQKSVDQQTGN
ncbi:MAG: FecR domain-containing protein [Bdellovibrionia bacterium]